MRGLIFGKNGRPKKVKSELGENDKKSRSKSVPSIIKKYSRDPQNCDLEKVRLIF